MKTIQLDSNQSKIHTAGVTCTDFIAIYMSEIIKYNLLKTNMLTMKIIGMTKQHRNIS